VSGVILERFARLRLFGKSPFKACLRIHDSVWACVLPPRAVALRPVISYGRFVHSLVVAHADRRMYLGTFFFRNRPELALMARLCQLAATGRKPVRIAVLGCSNGAEVYSIAYTLRSTCPELRFLCSAVDLSESAVEVGRMGEYPSGLPNLVEERMFERMRAEERERMFELDGGLLRVKPWLREGIEWRVGDATHPALAASLGPQDVVVANRFLCHLGPAEAEECLRAVARLVAPGGYLFVSGVDLEVRTRVALDLGWEPVDDALEDLHEGDPSLRAAWPARYYGLEPIDKRRPDWKVRYASVFQLA
jgi:chemotaxis methyl-accepting protein methylase